MLRHIVGGRRFGRYFLVTVLVCEQLVANLGNSSEHEDEVSPDYTDLLVPLDELPTADDIDAVEDGFGVDLEALTSVADALEEELPLDVGELLDPGLVAMPEEAEAPLFEASACVELLASVSDVPADDESENKDDEWVDLWKEFPALDDA